MILHQGTEQIEKQKYINTILLRKFPFFFFYPLATSWNENGKSEYVIQLATNIFLVFMDKRFQLAPAQPSVRISYLFLSL